MSPQAAEQALNEGNLKAAISLCDNLLALDPGNVDALRCKGMALVRANRNQDAVECFLKAVEVSPADFVALDWLHGSLMQVHRFADAVAIGKKALALRPNDSTLLLSLSQGLIRIGKTEDAVACLEHAKELDRGNPATRHLLGQAYEKSKRNDDALGQYLEAIRLRPAFGDAYSRASRILLEEGFFERALALCNQAKLAIPNGGQAWLQTAQALMQKGRSEEAMESAHKAVYHDPDLAEPAATWFEAHGLYEDAASVREESIKQRPVQGRAYYGIVKSRKMTCADRPLLTKIENMVKSVEPNRAPQLPPRERLALLRALGKAADDMGEYERAMGYFDEAAQLGAAVFGAENAFDPKRLEAARKNFLGFFDRSFFERYRDLGLSGHLPIFVIGMIRSGTTLVQQILTSHTLVGDAGEQPFWTTAFPGVLDLSLGAIKGDRFLRARDRYLAILRRYDSKSPVISNKWPMNYAHAGLLLVAYPDAKIISVERNPVDTALSIYMTDLGEPPPEFAHSKAHIVAVYRDYQARMDHWRRLLPSGSIFTLRYEDLVADQEQWSRRIIEFCGLEWDSRCLDFSQGARRVQTPSMLQVRRPIYATSVDKWRHYEPWLGQFADLKKLKPG